MIAAAIRDVFHDVEVEPQLLPIQSEDMLGITANRANEARLDIRTKGFWTRQQDTFLHPCYSHQGQAAVEPQAMSQLGAHEREKKGNMRNV